MFTFTGRIDAKGRITVPAPLRDRLRLDPGDDITLRLDCRTVDRYEAADAAEAQQLLADLDDAVCFDYRDGVLEVVRDA